MESGKKRSCFHSFWTVSYTHLSGFGGRIIEKEYRYNEYIADKCLLLEIGNNQNKIEEVENTGKYFARVLAEVIEEEK